MQKFNSLTDTTIDTKLENLLLQRKAPLSEEGMKKVLEELTLYMAGDRRFYIAFYPKEDVIPSDHIQASDIDRVDLMQATDDEKYLPVFSTLEGLQEFKPTLQKDEHIYIVTKQDLLDFLNINTKVAAAVLNPLVDDLLLYRMQLQNLIQVQTEQLSKPRILGFPLIFTFHTHVCMKTTEYIFLERLILLADFILSCKEVLLRILKYFLLKAYDFFGNLCIWTSCIKHMETTFILF